MSKKEKLVSSPVDRAETSGHNRPTIPAPLKQFEKHQAELWWLTIFLLLVVSLAFALLSWPSLRIFANYSEALPLGLVALIALFGIYVWKRAKEIADLRALVRSIERRFAEPEGNQQLGELSEIVHRSQQRYRELIDSLDDVLLGLTPEGDIRVANRSFTGLVDTPFPEIIGKPLADFVQDASGEGLGLLQSAVTALLEKRQWSGVVQVRLKNQDTVYYFDCVAHAMTRADKIHGITLLARDVTSLRKNEARFTELFETLQEGIYIATPQGDIVDANPALVKMLGYHSREELLAKKIPEIFVDDEARKIAKTEIDRQLLVQGSEVTLSRKDGSSLVCLNTATAIRDVSGTVVRYQGALTDMTTRHEMERRLHQQQEFARRLVDSFPDLIFVLDTSAHYTFISPRIVDVLGFHPGEESRHLELGGRTHPDDSPALRSLYEDILAGRESFASLEMRVLNKHGDWRRIRCHFSPLFDKDGKIDGVVISGRDVTDLKRLEEQLIQAEKLAAMGQMLAGVAHELNNPLTAILGVTELLRERETSDDTVKRQLDLTHRQARRAARIVQNLLEFSRPASPLKKPLDLNNLVERTLQLQEHSLRRNNIQVMFHAQPGLPSIIGDGNQLIQVFLNLVTNAEQAIREVRTDGHIQIFLTRRDNRLVLSIHDDGVGIRPDALPRIFDPFYTTKRPGGGTGLGLSICMSIVREHGGTLEAEALDAGGSAFRVYLPIAVDSSAVISDIESAASAPIPTNVPDHGQDQAMDQPLGTPADSLRGRSILVLDDNESIRMLLEEGLSARGLRVDCAATTEEALALAGKSGYDVLLCDVHLLSGGAMASGQDAAARIVAAAAPQKPIIVYMTGDLVEAPSGASENGAPRYLQKPFPISQVLALLREIASPPPASISGR
jgi:PAS domain S-box-containing protein